jgi:hypothetical protein
VNPATAQVVRATIGGTCLRVRDRREIERAFRDAEPAELSGIVRASHLAGPFARHFGRRMASWRGRSDLRQLVRAQRVHNRFIMAQLAALRQPLASAGIHPILLKGPSLWGWLYRDVGTRRTRDVDLLLVDSRQLVRTVEVLTKLGFTADGAELEAALRAVDHYELPTFVTEVAVRVDRRDDDALRARWALEGVRSGLRRLGARHYGVMLEIELHRSFFLYSDGSLASVPTRAVVEHPLMAGYRRLTLAAQLPYIAAKFGIDARTLDDPPVRAQSLKLLADFVRLIEQATPAEIAASVGFARRWLCEEYYARTAATVAPLLPSVTFCGMTASPYNLAGLIASAGKVALTPVAR